MSTSTGCPTAHPIWSFEGPGFVDTLEVLGGHATDTCVRCRLCGRVFWTVCDMGRWQYMAEWEIDPALAHRAVVEHDAAALAELFVSKNLPHGPVWDLTLGLVEIFRALTPGSNDAERARALRDAKADARWTEAIRVLETAARGVLHGVREASFPVDVRLSGRAVREWHEVGDALVLLTEQSEMLRLEGRGVTRLDLAASPRYVAAGNDRLTLAVGDHAFLVMDAAGLVSTWDTKGAFKADALDDGWWVHVPQADEPVRVIELRRPDGRACVGFKRAFVAGARWMPPPRRMGDGWILTNLVDDDGATQALSLVDAAWKLAAQSGACPPADRRITPIDGTRFLAEVDGAVERWVRRGAALELLETIPCRSCWWIKDRLVVDGADGVVTSRSSEGVVQWTWSRETAGATYGAVGRDSLLLYDDEHAHWLALDGTVRKSFDVESASVLVGREGTLYLKSLVDLWVLFAGEAHLLAVDLDMDLETVCGDEVVLRDERGHCLLIDRSRRGARFEARDAQLPVTGTRGGPWLVEGDRVRGGFEKNAHMFAEAIAMTVGAASRVLPGERHGDASVVVLPDGRAPYLVLCWSPGYGRIEFAGGGNWSFAAGDDIAAIVNRAASALKGWLGSSSPAKPTLYEIALAVLDLVTETFGERWTVSIPGTVGPSEMWLRGPVWAANAVGIFDGRVNVASVELVPIDSRGALVLRREAIVAAVKEQRARYARHASRTGAVMEIANRLASLLSIRLAKACEVVAWGWTSYERTVEPRIVGKDDPHRTLVWIRAEDERVHVHGGAWGRAGWSTDGTDVDAMVEPLAQAIERGEDLFCVGRLRAGARYRVASDYGKLKAGEVVTVEGLDEIDNHYGELVFRRADGSEVRFGGDYSNPEEGWVGELYLVFEKA
jgi:hypothetical protein